MALAFSSITAASASWPAIENRCSNRQGTSPETLGTTVVWVGESELRIDFGRRYRVYCAIDDKVVVLSCGCDRTACFEALAARQRWDQFLRDLARRAITIPRVLRQTALHDTIEGQNFDRLSRQMIVAVQQAG